MPDRGIVVTGALVVLALIAGIVAFTVRSYRQRVRSNLQRLDHELPPELKQQLAAMRTQGARPGAVAATAVPTQATRRPAPVAATLPVPAPHFLLIYDVGPDFVQRRDAHRQEHLALAWRAAATGELLLAGALEPPTEQAFLLFRGAREAAERFARADPYVRHGLVTQWRVKQWYTVAGAGAATPMRPHAAVVASRPLQ